MNSNFLNIINTSTRSIPDLCRDLKFFIYCTTNNCMINESGIKTLTYFRNTKNEKEFVQRITGIIKKIGFIKLLPNKKTKDYDSLIEENSFSLPEIEPKNLFNKMIEDQETYFVASKKEEEYVTLSCYFDKGVLYDFIDLLEEVVKYNGKGLSDYELTYVEAYIAFKNKEKVMIKEKELSNELIRLRSLKSNNYEKKIKAETTNLISKLDVFSKSNKTEYPRKTINDLSKILGLKKINNVLTIDKSQKTHLRNIKNVKTKNELFTVLKNKKQTEKKLLDNLINSKEKQKKSLKIYEDIKEKDLLPTHFEFKQILKMIKEINKSDILEISKNKINIASQIQLNSNDTIVVPDAGTTPGIPDFGFIYKDFNFTLELTKIFNEGTLIRSEIIQCYEHLSETHKSLSFVIHNSKKEKFDKYTREINIGKKITADKRRLIGLSVKEYDILLNKIKINGLSVLIDYYDLLEKNLLSTKDGYPWFNEFID